MELKNIKLNIKLKRIDKILTQLDLLKLFSMLIKNKLFKSLIKKVMNFRICYHNSSRSKVMNILINNNYYIKPSLNKLLLV